MLQNFNLCVTQFFFKDFIHFASDLSHKMHGVTQLKLALVDKQVNRPRRSSLNHDSIEACKLEFSREKAATLTIANAPTDR